ncbi:FAD/NAD(P)-binding protein [Streptomyces sp. XH2]|uniref:FAD/NAD(P)-binding protein n=1 Tax=Streptomyces sp. XH2 TaxID=3412483 RepID=UPI003C7CDF55
MKGDTGREVVVIGGGVAGTSLLLQLVRTLAGRRPPHPVRSVRVVDPRPAGWGLAFGDEDPLLLCNSAAELNSLLADRPGDFVDHLRAQGRPGSAKDCVPRARMAEYCADRAAWAREQAGRSGITVEHVRASAETIGTEADGGGHRVRLSTGQELYADDVVVCTGVQRPRVPRGFAEFRHHPRYLDSPYPASRIRQGLRPRSRVLVLGSHQSATDAALLLCRDGHRATLSSPSGKLPAVRESLAAPLRAYPPLERISRLDPADPYLEDRLVRCVVEAVRLHDRRPLRRQVSRACDPVQRLREETALAEAGACAWPDVIVPLIERVIELAPELPAGRLEELSAKFAGLTDRYATALARVNARRLLAHFDSGMLRLARPYPRAVSFEGGLWHVERSGAAPETYDYVVNATGFERPVLHWDREGTALHLDGAPAGGTAVGRLEADLRVRREPGAAAQRVWVVGVGTHVRIPFANHLRNVVRQAGQVADRLTEPVPDSTFSGISAIRPMSSGGRLS